MKTFPEMIACAKREAAIRRNVYPKWVESGRMKADQCRHEIETMEAIVTELETKIKIIELEKDGFTQPKGTRNPK